MRYSTTPVVYAAVICGAAPLALPISAAGQAPAICFAPGTTSAQMEAARWRAAALGPSTSLIPQGEAFQFGDGDRWSVTATDGFGLSQGDPTTLTWSIVPDGTSITGFIGESSAPSNLRAFLNGVYGSQAVWLPLFERVFARWGELTGITYVYEPSDDGVALANFAGRLGVRGDVRIGGHFIDGGSGVLAYNFFPNNGDMILDTGDAGNFSNTLLLRNTLAHEHGHGLGLDHVCPINGTKLMEPFLTLVFDGPQHDDVLAANRGYGDAFENDDTIFSAAPLGALAAGSYLLGGVSIDDNSDGDYYRLTVNQPATLDLLLSPVGGTYLSGPQNPNGSCSNGTSFNSLTIHDLGIEVLDAAGGGLASADASGVGQSETVTGLNLPSAGDYLLRIFGGTTNAAQLYQVELTLSGGANLFSDGFESGDTSLWSAVVP